MAKRNVGLGFVISAVDRASKEFRSFGKNVTGSLASIRGALMMQHPALALLRTGWRMVSSAIESAVKTALQFQSGAVRQEFTEFGRSVELVKARIGDALLPTVRALMESLKPLIDRTTEWLTANNKVAASRVLDFTLSLGRVLTNVVVPAVGFTMKSFLGLLTVWDLIRMGWNRTLQLIFFGFEQLNAGVVSFLTMLGEKAASLGEVLPDSFGGEQLRSLGAGLVSFAEGGDQVTQMFGTLRETFKESADENVADLNRHVEAIDAVTQVSGTLKVALESVYSDVTINGAKQLDKAVAGGTKSLKDQEEAAKKLKEALDSLAASTKSYMDISSSIVAAIGAWGDEEERKQREADERMAAARALARERSDQARQEHVERTQQNLAYAQSLGAVFGEIASGQMKNADAAKAAQLVILDIIEKEIMAYAAAAATRAASSQAHIPVVGPVLAAAAAAAMFALLRGYLAKFHEGGIFRAPAGRREGIALLEDREEILTTDDPRHRANLGGRAVRGPAPALARHSSAPDLRLTIVMPPSVVPESDVSFERKSRALLRTIQRALDNGQLVLPNPAGA